MEEDSSTPSRRSTFPTTQWTLIMEAVSTNPERAREAFEKLCAMYREPIVNWFRRKDFYQDPEDLTHDFVAYLVDKCLLHRIAPRTGKFRCFLATAMQKFLWDSWDKSRAKKRGGGVKNVSLADNDADIEAESSPDSQLDLDFALVIHRRVMGQLAPPEPLKPYIFQKDSTEGWTEIAGRLNNTPTVIRKEVSRLRRKHWENFRDEVAQIVSPTDRAEETRYLYELLFKNLPLE